MRRREFIGGMTSAAAWPLVARAQQTQMPKVGLLNSVSFEGPYALAVAAIRRGLQETGFVEGRNLAIEYRSADGHYERFPELATDLVRRQVRVIVAIAGSIPALAADTTSSPIPIVYAMGADAVEVGVVDGLERPQTNTTGANATAAPVSRRLELLLEMRRGARLVGYLDNSRSSSAFETNVENVTTAARIKEREVLVLDAGSEHDIETAFTHLALQRARGLVIGPDPFLTSRQEQIIELAAQSGLPTIYATRGAVLLGGLMSYGVFTDDMYRLAGIYAGRILKGEPPADLPFALPTRFELVINKRTAQALRITLPRQLLIRADELID
jgi:putative ABC transport system substrate-binding protein